VCYVELRENRRCGSVSPLKGMNEILSVFFSFYVALEDVLYTKCVRVTVECSVNICVAKAARVLQSLIT
jgi:hypothetical protein